MLKTARQQCANVGNPCVRRLVCVLRSRDHRDFSYATRNDPPDARLRETDSSLRAIILRKIAGLAKRETLLNLVGGARAITASKKIPGNYTFDA